MRKAASAPTFGVDAGAAPSGELFQFLAGYKDSFEAIVRGWKVHRNPRAPSTHASARSGPSHRLIFGYDDLIPEELRRKYEGVLSIRRVELRNRSFRRLRQARRGWWTRLTLQQANTSTSCTYSRSRRGELVLPYEHRVEPFGRRRTKLQPRMA